MLKTRTIAFSLTVAAVAAFGAGCQSRAEDATATAAAGRAPADNTAEVCDAFRHFEVDHRELPAGTASSFDTVAAADMKKLADRATDPSLSAHLRAVSTQIAALADQSSGKTYDQVAAANPEIFAAGGQAWVALEDRCGKAVIPTA